MLRYTGSVQGREATNSSVHVKAPMKCIVVRTECPPVAITLGANALNLPPGKLFRGISSIPDAVASLLSSWLTAGYCVIVQPLCVAFRSDVSKVDEKEKWCPRAPI